MHNDLMHYPPMISLIDILCELGEKVTYIGDYSNSPTISRFQSQNVGFVHLPYKRSGSQFHIIKTQRNYKRQLIKTLTQLEVNKNDLIWYIYSDSATFIHDILARYRYLVHYYEFDRQDYSWKFKLLYPSFTQEKLVHGAVGVIHCEYNRAQIFKGMTGLDRVPFVLPNKPYVKEGAMDENKMPTDIKKLIDDVRSKVRGKKVVLYQGIFNSKERRLEEFCKAISLLPEEYMLIAMGRGDSSFDQLKMSYESDRILFIPFIIPPFHLLVTQLASVGVLSYSPVSKTYYGVINPLYCAPNKIFEYSRYGKPMISNDIPGLSFIFEKYSCGCVVTDPITPDKIAETLIRISADYHKYSHGAMAYYDSINLHSIVSNILLESTSNVNV